MTASVKQTVKYLIVNYYLTGKIKLEDIAKQEGVTLYDLNRVLSEYIGREQYRFSRTASALMGSKKEAYYTEEELINGIPEYKVEDLDGEEKGILTLIERGEIKVEL